MCVCGVVSMSVFLSHYPFVVPAPLYRSNGAGLGTDVRVSPGTDCWLMCGILSL